MKVLVACEESQEVCKAFREKGHEAYSCDIQHCALWNHMEWHIVEDVRQIIGGGAALPPWTENNTQFRGIGI